MSEQPATNAGSTSAAGEGVDDSKLAEQVADQTDSNLEVEEAFERESGGAATDTEAAKASGDDLK
jgi:protease I